MTAYVAITGHPDLRALTAEREFPSSRSIRRLRSDALDGGLDERFGRCASSSTATTTHALERMTGGAAHDLAPTRPAPLVPRTAAGAHRRQLDGASHPGLRDAGGPPGRGCNSSDSLEPVHHPATCDPVLARIGHVTPTAAA